jgi:hypothetical protein
VVNDLREPEQTSKYLTLRERCSFRESPKVKCTLPLPTQRGVFPVVLETARVENNNNGREHFQSYGVSTKLFEQD